MGSQYELPGRPRRRSQHGASDTIIWQRQGAMLLSRYLTGRKRVPLFVTERPARRDLGLTTADLDELGRARLSYDHAEAIFKAGLAARPCTSCGTRA